MKKLLLLVLTASGLFAAGVVNQNIARLGTSNSYVITMNWTADASNGSVPATQVTGGSSSAQQALLASIQGYFFVSVETTPGTPAPTNNYRVTITDPSGADLLQGAGSATSAVAPQIFGVPGSSPALNQIFTLNVTQNAISSAKGAVYIFLNAQQSSGGSGGGGGGGGTVTNITTVSPILGGPITSSGALSCPTCAETGIDINSSNQVTATHLTTPLPVLQGGTGTTTPALVPGTNVTISGTWPNQTINSSGGGGGGAATSITPVALASLPGTCTVADIRYVTDATVSAGGYYLYLCTATNTWTQFGYVAGGSGFLASACTAGACTIDVTASVVGITGTYTMAGSYDFSGATSFIPKAVPLTAGTSVTLSGTSRFFVCTGTCTVTVPVPAAGVQFCVYNDDNVSTVITLAAIGSSARYENTARTAYGTAGTGTFISGGAVADAVCIIGRDATHYLTTNFTGTWTAN